MGTDKAHYYDGKIYELVFDRALKQIRDIIVAQIKPGSNVIDIGCGTGSLVFALAKKCSFATGVELSTKMFEHAKRRQLANKIENTRFIHGDASNLPGFNDKQFDYATFSMAIHEMPPDLRTKVLMEAKRIAEKIIIADFAAPMPHNVMGIISRIIEFSAGIDHFRCFLNFQRNNGIGQLLSICRLSVYNELTVKSGAMKIVTAYSPSI